MDPPPDTIEGVSYGERGSFADAARDAAKKYEESMGDDWASSPPKTLRVIESSITVGPGPSGSNPIHDYRIVFGR